MKGKIIMLLTVVCVIILASLPKSISAPVYRDRQEFREERRRQEELAKERIERQREERKARAEARKERAKEKRQDMLYNRKIVELEQRIQQLEYALQPFIELPDKLINSEDKDLYKSTYDKLRNDACVALVVNNAIRTANVADVKLKQRKTTDQLEDEVYRIILERFLERYR
jgi:hypothetical protein